MFTNDEAQALIETKKELKDSNQFIDLALPKNRVYLIAPSEPDYEFFLEITSNQKIQFKISLHHQESYSNIGLVRLDFKGRHQNPASANSNLPDKFKPYIGRFFERDEPHIHFYVEGYKPLAWAMPLNRLEIKTQVVNDIVDFNEIIVDFSAVINIVSSLRIQQALV